MGTSKDYDLARYWLIKAKENGEEDVEVILEDLETIAKYERLYGDQLTGGSGSSVTILMNKRGSVYYVPCKINGLKSDFVFDTGAGIISLSSEFATRLSELGLLTDDDIVGETNLIVADGRSNSATVVNIKDVEIAGLHINNVEAAINPNQNAPLLLGQSAIEKLGKITIDGCKLTIHR